MNYVTDFVENSNRMKDIHNVILTFDIEDFINENAVNSLLAVLQLLNKYKLRGIFFISGHMAEKLRKFPEILDLLKGHEIGFHSSGHSVRPFIQEYTDVKSYDQAYSISVNRENSHIDPLTGEAKGKGGISLLKEIFYPKKIESYRAPGNSWTPPHLEALVHFGIKFDFSSNITTSNPVHYNGVTFYPNTFVQHWDGKLSDYSCLLSALLKRKVSVFDLHPTLYVNKIMWDSIYYKGNPQTLLKVPKLPLNEAKSLFMKFELLLKQLIFLQNTGLIKIKPDLCTASTDLTMSKNDLRECYLASIRWPKTYFKYTPKFIHDHFQKYFEAAMV
jgi:hypothetical protein